MYGQRVSTPTDPSSSSSSPSPASRPVQRRGGGGGQRQYRQREPAGQRVAAARRLRPLVPGAVRRPRGGGGEEPRGDGRALRRRRHRHVRRRQHEDRVATETAEGPGRWTGRAVASRGDL